MENNQRPAHPQPLTMGTEGDVLTPIGQHDDFAGFTKLELASLMIAQGMAAYGGSEIYQPDFIAKFSTSVAKAVLEEANK